MTEHNEKTLLDRFIETGRRLVKQNEIYSIKDTVKGGLMALSACLMPSEAAASTAVAMGGLFLYKNTKGRTLTTSLLVGAAASLAIQIAHDTISNPKEIPLVLASGIVCYAMSKAIDNAELLIEQKLYGRYNGE